MQNKLKKYSLCFFFIFIVISCNAPRNNPLDPENPDKNTVSIEGYIKTINVPQMPISGAEVFWINDGIITTSDDQGYFIIDNIQRKDGWLTIEKENYSIDTLMVNFGNERKITTNIFLNANPKIVDLKFYSITKNKFKSAQKYNLEVVASIIDEENDIDSVFIQNIELNTRRELFYNASTKLYENSLFLEDLNITSIDVVIGKDFHISVFDSEGKKFVIGKSNIKRIIKEEIETTSPLGRDTVETGNPQLQWQKFTPGFSFRYLLQIYTDEIPALLAWEREINSSLVEYQADADLLPGDYFWVIWAIDEFDNRTRSKPSSFIVK